MKKKPLSGLGSVIFWVYGRGTVQYDILCGLILAFIFLTPRYFFQDWPVFNNPNQFSFGDQIVNTFDHNGNPVLNISAQLIPGSMDNSAVVKAARSQLQKSLNRPISIVDVKPIRGENGETVGYSVWLGQENPRIF